ncbi:MAG: ABC transporter ATP-binding protein [Alphaproteobacteria bacterium]|nr:ABC transporter ATP-binding protein [Alphaproteobacteria bacterium]
MRTAGGPRPDQAGGRAFPRHRRPVGFLTHYVGRHAIGHGIVLASVLVAVMCAVSTQYGLKHLIDIVSAGPGSGGVWAAFALLCGLIAADNLSWRVGGWAAAHVFVTVTGDIRRDLFAHLSGHAPAYFAERLPGSLASRITATSNAVFTVENAGSWNVLPPCIAVICSIALVCTVNPLMALVLVGLSAGLAALIFTMARNGTPLHRAFAARAAAVDGELVDVIGNFNVVRAFGATMREQRRFAGIVEGEMAARRTSLLYLERLRLIHAVLTAILTAGLVGWGILMWQRGQATPGDIVLIASLGLTILHSTRDLAVALVDLTQHMARLEEAIGALLTEHDLTDHPEATKLIRGAGQVRFEGVSFSYPGRGAVLEDFTLAIEPGQRVGLVGTSGAGKSTVLALLQRFYDVHGGRILIDGKDISRITQESLRRQLAIVPQDISLFHRTVMQNIRYARPDATEEEVMAAAEMARCREFIEALPDGFATMVGDRGVMLSGGQRQRIAIARALLKDAPILLLDEATSALDTDSERAIQAALDRLMRGRTVIAIAHRLSTLSSFDRIVVMDRGRIIDDGPPAILAGRPGPYRDLLCQQQQFSDIPAVAA